MYMHRLHRRRNIQTRQMKDQQDNTARVSFPFHFDSNFVHLKDNVLTQAAGEVQGCIHQKINIYLHFASTCQFI